MPVYPLLITCPATGAAVETGFVMTRMAFDEATLTDVRLDCPRCRETHLWSIEDARLGKPVSGEPADDRRSA
jgi:hypothetical protein